MYDDGDQEEMDVDEVEQYLVEPHTRAGVVRGKSRVRSWNDAMSMAAFGLLRYTIMVVQTP